MRKNFAKMGELCKFVDSLPLIQRTVIVITYLFFTYQTTQFFLLPLRNVLELLNNKVKGKKPYKLTRK